MKRVALIFSLLSLASLSARAAGPARLADLLPPDTLGFVEVDPSANPAYADQPAPLIDLGLKTLQSVGVLQKETSLYADIMALAGEAQRGRSCFAWLDADLAATQENRLDCRSSQLVFILETDQPGVIVERLTRVLAHFSSKETARQSIKTAGEGHKEFVAFADVRWPAWMTLAWMQEGGGGVEGQKSSKNLDLPPVEVEKGGENLEKGVQNLKKTQKSGRFVITLGPGAMEHYLADRTVAEAEEPLWGRMAAVQKPPVGNELARVYISTKSFRDRFPDAMGRTSLGKLFGDLDLNATDACVFTATIFNREISLQTMSLDGRRVTINPWTVAVPKDAAILKAVPDDASAYLVMRADWGKMYQRVTALVDGAITDPTDEPVVKMLGRIAKAEGVDVQKDILSHLQPLVVIHDSPRHPLRLPLMVTAVAAAEPGFEGPMKAAVAAFTRAGVRALEEKKGGVQIRTTADGVSYLQFGLVGPAWGWSQGRLIFSWSPGAVRGNVPAAGRVTSGAFGEK